MKCANLVADKLIPPYTYRRKLVRSFTNLYFISSERIAPQQLKNDAQFCNARARESYRKVKKINSQCCKRHLIGVLESSLYRCLEKLSWAYDISILQWERTCFFSFSIEEIKSRIFSTYGKYCALRARQYNSCVIKCQRRQMAVYLTLAAI